MTSQNEHCSEELKNLQLENEALRKQVETLRALAIDQQEKSARLASEPMMKTVRALYRKMKKGDPFLTLRPMLNNTEHETSLQINMDNQFYYNGKLYLRGWAFDHLHRGIPRIMVRDRSVIVPCKIHYYVRADVNRALNLPDDAKCGFTVELDEAQAKRSEIQLEFETEYGFVQSMLTLQKNTDDVPPVPFYAEEDLAYNIWASGKVVGEEELQKQKETAFPHMPLISICIPLYNTNPEYFGELMDCLLNQSYQKIEICLADGSPDDRCKDMVALFLGDERVKYKKLSENLGIAGNTNAAIEMAVGEFIMLSDHDDTIEKNAVFEIVKAINEDDCTDVIYTDEDKLIEGEGTYASPNFKPDFNPDLLCSNNYITHIIVVRSSIVKEIGGEDSAYDGAQDYDFILKACEKARVIKHIPKVLYHWRAHRESTAGNPESKMYAAEAGRRAIEAHYRRVGIPAKVELAENFGSYRSVYEIQGEPLISIIIPNKDMKDVLKRAVDSIFERSSYRNFEILIVENNSETAEIFEYYDELEKAHDNVRVLKWKDGFNYSAINNFAVKDARGDYLLFLNNDVEVISETWLEEMLGYSQRKDVGAVGARLYYPDDTIQHCGVVVGLGGIAGHILSRVPKDSLFYGSRLANTCDVSAVTAACLMMRKEVFEEIGGFEEAFVVAYNDIDLCLKVREKNYLCVYASRAELYHHESLSRGSDEEAVDAAKHERQMQEAHRLKDRWPEIFEKGDPFFNPNLDYNAGEYVLSGTAPKPNL